MIESPTKGMGCSMLITTPSMVMESRSSSMGSTTSVSSAGSSKKTTNKEEEVEGREHLLLRLVHHHHSVSFDHPGTHCRPLLKNEFSRGFSRTGIREENHFHFLHDKEANDEEQKGTTTDDDDHGSNASGGCSSSSSSCWWQEEPPPCGRGQEVSAHARHLSSSILLTKSLDNLLVPDSSSSRTTSLFTDGLKRLQECMTRTAESRQRLLVQQQQEEEVRIFRRSRSSGCTSTTTASIRSMKTFVALRAAARRDKKVELLFLTGDRGRGIKKNHGRMIVACPQDCHSSCANSVGRKEHVTSTNGSSCKGRSMSTWPTKKKKQQQQGLRALKQQRKAITCRTGVAFRPLMAECLLEGYPR